MPQRRRPTTTSVLTADGIGCCAPVASAAPTSRRAVQRLGRGLGPAVRLPPLRKPRRFLGVFGAVDLASCHRPALELLGSLLAVQPWIERHCIVTALDLAGQGVEVASNCPVLAHKVSVGVPVLYLETRPRHLL
jgi:hypothetical protein